MAPTFLVRVDVMRPQPAGFGQSVDSYGRWTPPKAFGGNISAGGGTSGLYYYCDGQRIVQSAWPTNPPPTHFKTYSVYFQENDFYVANGDATRSQVGDGKAPQSETEEDSEEEDEEKPKPPFIIDGWFRMSFTYCQNYVSHVCYDGEQRKLCFQHAQQDWVRMLFPPAYHADILSQPGTHYGGLTGDLPLFLALIMFSVQENLGHWALTSLFQGGSWTPHTQPHGRGDRRGMVVSVWAWPPTTTTPTHLAQLENGVFGKFFY
ncbi:hypothetical protein BU16DRAFT_350522 [Lophium mytilinum]|uniref:Uncharacterized protein n=1 Tax=Lophium mytilinum TaxID=390894 RepID=A0A6A6R137_9PEZI|nr:hypothetical protein BU16DRAFT_350522 [Lophium mytilinum]